jgi:hypothetical protein
MNRIRALAVLTVIAALALAGVSMAASSKTKVTGGQSTVTVSSAAATVLTQNNIKVAAISPATLSGTTLTFPIAGGKLNSKLHGYINHKGGFSLSNGTKTVKLRRPTIRTTKGGSAIWALVAKRTASRCHRVGRHHRRLKCKVVTHMTLIRIAKLTGVKVTGQTASANVTLTGASAQIINKLAGKKVAKAGEPIGTATTAPTFS